MPVKTIVKQVVKEVPKTLEITHVIEKETLVIHLYIITYTYNLITNLQKKKLKEVMKVMRKHFFCFCTQIYVTTAEVRAEEALYRGKLERQRQCLTAST